MSTLRKLVSQCADRLLVANARPASVPRGRVGAAGPRRNGRTRPRLEQLEDRLVPAPTVLDPNLEVRTVIAGLSQPTSMAFLNPDNSNDFFVLEKNTGRVQRVVHGLKRPVLDLAVNSASERGLLGIALHPNFNDSDGPAPRWVYLYWTESSTGADSTVTSQTTLLGNRVDRFIWDGRRLKFDQNIIRLRAEQPVNPPFETQERGNHDGGVIRFGPDGKLYIFIGDVGRRGFTQNVLVGHAQDGMDDQFGGPEPGDAHLTGVTLRLNGDGSAPEDNPFFQVGAEVIAAGEEFAEVGANFQKIFSYGHRNSFGMAFDPFTGSLWNEENGDNSFTEINLVEPGMNGGWVQVMGPLSRVSEFKLIETGGIPGMEGLRGLQQLRFSPDELPNTPEEALANLFQLEGSHYSDPEFSWKFEVAPAGIGFLASSALGEQYLGNLFVGAARTFLAGGQIWRFQLNDERTGFTFTDPRLDDLVADNRFTSSGATSNQYDITESESLLFGFNFGIATDIQTGPNGNLFVVSNTPDGAVYEVRPKAVAPGGTFFTAILTGDQEVPPSGSSALAIATFQLSEDQTSLRYTINIFGLDLGAAFGAPSTTGTTADDITRMHIHRAPAGVNGPIVFGMIDPLSDQDAFFVDIADGVVTGDWDLTEGSGGATLESELDDLLAGGLYLNIHTTTFPGGEIRGQILPFGSTPN